MEEFPALTKVYILAAVSPVHQLLSEMVKLMYMVRNASVSFGISEESVL